MMKMPKYAMSAAEAKTLADFFAAHAGTTRIDPPDAPTRRLAAATDDEDTANRRDQAMRVLIDRKTFCAKCHVVGDYRPPGATATVGPDLAEAGRRLQAEYIRRWLADPRAKLPYTPMPVNFPPSGEPLGQDLLPGASTEQIDAVTDLLEYYDDYLRSKRSVREMMNP
ncbi:MAG TPA: hypothetical protein DD670_11095 [Planctomycetaceae bacterium]|nr:hypothetical protein [Planctomycetaceae bacterium]